MASLKALSKQHNEIKINHLENNNYPLNTSYFPNAKTNPLSQETKINFLMCKCIALEDIHLDIELTNNLQNDKVSETEISNHIYYYKNKIKRTFNKQSKFLLSTIPDFQLE